MMGSVARLINRLGGNIRWQHLPVPFEVYADGIDLVIFEESKFGVRMWHRNFFDADIVACPDASVIGKSFGEVGEDRGGLHPVDAFLDLVLEHGRALRWRTTISNHRPDVLKKLAREPGIQMGFSDAGAHLRNMAFYNMGLRLLRHVRDAEKAGKPFMTVEEAVHRLTGELADWYRIDAGHLRIGDRADLVVVDPARLDSSLDAYAEASVDHYGGLSRMVNRNDETVKRCWAAARCSSTARRPTSSASSAPGGSCAPPTRPRRFPLLNPSWQVSAEETVLGLWKALADRDWDSLKTFLSDDCIYLDMPVGPRRRHEDQKTSSSGSR